MVSTEKVKLMSTKSLGKNAVFNVIYKCLNLIFPLITSIYVARVLLPAGVGKVSAAQNIVQYFLIFASLGLPTYGVKKIAEARENIEQRTKTFQELFFINAISSILCSILYIGFITVKFHQSQKIVLALVVGIKLYFNIINIDWFYQGVEEYKYIMLRSLAVKTISLAFIIALVRTSNDYVIYAGITSLSLVVNYVFNIANIKKYILKTKFRYEITQHLKPVLYLLAASFAIEIYTLADVTMLDIIKGDTIVGYYTTATRVIGMIRTLVTAICAVFLPRMSALYCKGDYDGFISLAQKGLSIIASIAVPVGLGLCLTAQESTIILFGIEYQPSVITMMIMSVSVFTVALSNFTGYQILITLGKEKIVLISTIIGAVLNVCLNALLIGPLSQNGAAIASIVTEGFIAAFQFTMVRKETGIGFERNLLSSVALPAVIMIIVVLLIKKIVPGLILSLVVEVFCGAFVYIMLSYHFDNYLIKYAIGKLKHYRK